MSADLAVQKAIREALTGSAEVLALVPASSIFDRHERPAADPSILLGESQALDNGTSLAGDHTEIFHSIHVWKKEPSLEGVKGIAAAIRSALRGRLVLDAPYHMAGQRVASLRFLRDPDGATAHAVVTFEALVTEDAP